MARMDDKGIRPGVWIVVLGSLAVAFLVVALLQSRRKPLPTEVAPQTEGKEITLAQPQTGRRDRATRNAPGAPAEDPPMYIEGLVYGEIDLREAKALMPDNLYWKWGAPTKDPDVLAAREEERKRRNEEYGKVLSGDANEDEVRNYYEYKRKLSADYLEFAEFMQRRFKDKGPEEYIGLLQLAMKMHAQRLQQLPAESEEAMQRSRDHAKAREEWARQKEEFGDPTPTPEEDADQ